MPVIVEFLSREDRLRAIDIMAEEEHGYEGIPRRRFLISNDTARLLKSREVAFRVIGGPEEERKLDTSDL